MLYKPERLDWDSSHFGIEIFRLLPSEGPKDTLTPLSSFVRKARDLNIKLLILRIPSIEPREVQKAEGLGFRLMDTINSWEGPISKGLKNLEPKLYTIKLLNSKSDYINIGNIARRAFSKIPTHWHSDKNIPKEKADLLYQYWASNSLKGLSNKVLAALLNKKIVGFITLNKKGKILNCPLNATDPNYYKKGIYTSIFKSALSWGEVNGCDRIEMTTQSTSIYSQRVWANTGMRLIKSYYTLHLWI